MKFQRVDSRSESRLMVPLSRLRRRSEGSEIGRRVHWQAADSVDWNLALGRTDTTWPHAARNNVLELHRAELWNDAQHQLRINELSGEASTLSLPQRAGTPREQLGSTFQRDLSITIQPRTKRMTAHLRRGKLCWSKARQDRVESEESDVEQVEPNAPSGQGGRGKPMAIGSGDVERTFLRWTGPLFTGTLVARRQGPSVSASLA